MMNLLSYEHIEEARDQEAKNHEGEVLYLDDCRGNKLRGDEIRPTAKTFDVVTTGNHGAVSVRDIGDEAQ